MKPPTTAELTEFTLVSYVKLLKYLRQIYKIVPFCDAPLQTRYLILRHDVDFLVFDALKFAQIEQDMGIKSTYFFLISNPFYNLYEKSQIKIVKEISKLGHEIGLHYYPSYYYSNGRNVKETLRREIHVLEEVAGKKVQSIARHGPWDRDPFAAIKGLINANHPFMRGDLYVHDSCRAWAYFEGLIKLLRDPVNRAQLLIHPENWQEEKIDRTALIGRLVQNSKYDHIVLKKRIEEVWSKDPLVQKYENTIKNRHLMRYYDSSHRPIPPIASNNSTSKAIKYYRRLIKYYLVHTQLGWNYNKTKKTILNKLKTQN